MNSKLIVARSWRNFELQQAIGLLNLYKKTWWIDIEYHLNINGNIDDRVIEHVYKFIPENSLIIYKDSFFKEYIREIGVEKKYIDLVDNWKWIYHLILYYYLYKEKNVNYLLTYDDDILFNERNIDEVIGCLKQQIPFAIGEKLGYSDKSLLGKLAIYFGTEFDINSAYWAKPSQHLSSNSGFMGLNNTIWSNFSSINDIFSLFPFEPFSYDNLYQFKTEKDKFLYSYHNLLPEQSFLSICNRAFSQQHIVFDESTGYDIDFDKITTRYDSKIEHYIGVRKFENLYKERLKEEISLFRNLLFSKKHISQIYNPD